MKRTRIILIIIFILLGLGLISYHYNLKPDTHDEIITEGIRGSMSPKAGVEMKRARDEFFHLMLRDPVTKQIPARIRQLEIEFALQIPERQLYRAKGGATAEITWKEAGPNMVGGRTRAMALDRSDPTGNTIVAAGVSGGVWKSADAGNTWKLTTAPDQNPSVTSLAQYPNNPNIWYYSAGERRGDSAGAQGGSAPLFGDGIYRSTDNAESWHLLPATFNDDKLWSTQVNFTSRIRINPQTGSVFLASNGFGIIRSTNGEIFNELVFGLVGGHFYVDLDIHENGRIVAALSKTSAGNNQNDDTAGLFTSTDDGSTWTDITPEDFPASHQRTVVAIAPSNPDIIYSFTYTGTGSGSDEDVRLFKIDLSDGTSSERSANLPPTFGMRFGGVNTQFNYNMMLSVHPSDESFLLLGATNLFRSETAFATPADNADVTWIGGYGKPGLPFFYPNQHPDQHIAVFDHTNPDR
ncbi:MAG: WD40/YVTN/BNR-like repeat-containing protein, partial [Balneolaceae bacterium]